MNQRISWDLEILEILDILDILEISVQASLIDQDRPGRPPIHR